MRLYLDDNCAHPVLAKLLKKGGHDVQLPSDVGMTGKEDAVHLKHSVSDQIACLTQNYGDFRNLHDLILACQGHHPGILVVRNDNNPKKDLDDAGIVKAIAKPEF